MSATTQHTAKYSPLQLITTNAAAAPVLHASLHQLDPSVVLLLLHGQQMGLRFWQDTADSERIMFDATQFNRLGGYTLSKGIKGDFLTRVKRIIEEQHQQDDDEMAESDSDSDSDSLIDELETLHQPTKKSKVSNKDKDAKLTSITTKDTKDDEPDHTNDDTSVSSKKRKQSTPSGAPGMRGRDNWESDSLSELVASGYTVLDLVDPRVGRTRVVNVAPDTLQQLLPVRESTLYLLHVALLSGWVEAKYLHAQTITCQWNQRDVQLSGATTESAIASTPLTASTASTSAELVVVAGWAQKVQKDLQIKSAATLHYVLVAGQLMEQARRLCVTTAQQHFRTVEATPPCPPPITESAVRQAASIASRAVSYSAPKRRITPTWLEPLCHAC